MPDRRYTGLAFDGGGRICVVSERTIVNPRKAIELTHRWYRCDAGASNTAPGRVPPRTEAGRIIFFADTCESGASDGRAFSIAGGKAVVLGEKFLDESVPGHARKIGYNQHPVMRGQLIGDMVLGQVEK